MSDIIKKAFDNICPEAEKRLNEKLKNGSELFGLYDVSKIAVCQYCKNELCDAQVFNQKCFKCGKKPF